MPYARDAIYMGWTEVQGKGRDGPLSVDMATGTMIEESEGVRKSEDDCGKWMENWKPEAEICWSNY